MKIWKPLVAILAVTVLGVAVGFVSCGMLFNWVYELEPTNVWKPMTGPPGVMFQLAHLGLNVVLVAAYLLIRKGLPGKSGLIKGLTFGLGVWAVGTLPGMFSTYAFMTVAPTVIIYWTILALVLCPLKGIIIAAICGK